MSKIEKKTALSYSSYFDEYTLRLSLNNLDVSTNVCFQVIAPTKAESIVKLNEDIDSIIEALQSAKETIIDTI